MILTVGLGAAEVMRVILAKKKNGVVYWGTPGDSNGGREDKRWLCPKAMSSRRQICWGKRKRRKVGPARAPPSSMPSSTRAGLRLAVLARERKRERERKRKHASLGA
jgi:hypothetical protein